MITACELCKNLERVADKKASTVAFCEEVLSPIIERLKEMPDNKFIGYLDLSCNGIAVGENLYSYEEVTRRKYLKTCTDIGTIVGRVTSVSPFKFILDYNSINDYLKPYGFILSHKKMTFNSVVYHSGFPADKRTVDMLYLTAVCPIKSKSKGE